MYRNLIRWCGLLVVLVAMSGWADSSSVGTFTKIQFYTNGISSMPTRYNVDPTWTVTQSAQLPGVFGLPFVWERVGNTTVNECGHGINVVMYVNAYHTNPDRYMEVLHTDNLGNFCTDGTWVVKLYNIPTSSGMYGWCTRSNDCFVGFHLDYVPVRSAVLRGLLTTKLGSFQPTGINCSTNAFWDSLYNIRNHTFSSELLLSAGNSVCPEESRNIATYTGWKKHSAHTLSARTQTPPFNSWVTWNTWAITDGVGGSFSAIQAWTSATGFTSLYATNRVSPIDTEYDGCYDYLPGSISTIHDGSSTHKAVAASWAESQPTPSVVDNDICYYGKYPYLQSPRPRSYATPSITYDRIHNIWYLLTTQPNKFVAGSTSNPIQYEEWHLYRSTNKTSWTHIAMVFPLAEGLSRVSMSYNPYYNELVFASAPQIGWLGGGVTFSFLTHAEVSTCSDCSSLINSRMMHTFPEVSPSNVSSMVLVAPIECDTGTAYCRMFWMSDETTPTMRTQLVQTGGLWQFVTSPAPEVVGYVGFGTAWTPAMNVIGQGPYTGTVMFAALGTDWNLYQIYRLPNGNYTGGTWYQTSWTQMANPFNDVKTGSPVITIPEWNGGNDWEWEVIYPHAP